MGDLIFRLSNIRHYLTNTNKSFYFLICFVLIFLSGLFGQEKGKVDSILDKLKIVQTDSSKIKLCLSLADHYKDNDPEEALAYYQEALKLATGVNNNKLVAQANIGIGSIHWDRGDLEKTSQFYSDALAIYQEIKDEKGLSVTYINLALLYWKLGTYNEGVKSILKALKISEKLNDDIGISDAYNAWGLISWGQEKYDKALEYNKKALSLREKAQYKKGIAESNLHMGLVYMYINRNEDALECFNKVLEIYLQSPNKRGLQIAYNFMGMANSHLNRFHNADKYFEKALDIAIDLKNEDEAALIYLNRSRQHHSMKSYKQSIIFAKNCLEMSKKLNVLLYQKMAYMCLSWNYDSLGNYKEAYENHKLYKQFNDSIFNETSSKQIIEMQTKYDTEKKVRENELLKKDNELQQLAINKETNFRNFLIVITALVLLLAVLLFSRIQDKKKNEIALENKVKVRTMELEKAKNRAEENDRLKSAFLANISHEIRTPMNGIMGFSELLKNPRLKDHKQKEFINKIEASGERMLTIINNLVEISKVESGQMDVSFSTVNVNEEIENIYASFKKLAEEKGIEFKYSHPLSNDLAMVRSDGEKLHAILNNLLKNAMKFTISGMIEIGYEKKGNNLEFFVKDTGIGIAEDLVEVIFERFIQADLSAEKSYDGAGLGLSLSKAYVELLGGKIWVESEYWRGSQFYFTIPYIEDSSKELAMANKIQTIEN